MANFGGARFASSKSPELGGARFASSESSEFRGVRVSVSPKIVIFVKNALKIPLIFFRLRRVLMVLLGITMITMSTSK